ncbi:MAG: DUF2341 domain-containing protein, partial [Candidatus Hodarchaeota archaeon]
MRGLYFFRFLLRYFKENNGYRSITHGFLLSIICLNLIIIGIPTQDDSFLESDDIITQLLKGFGLEKKEKNSYQSIPTLSKDNLQDSNSASLNNRFRLSPYYVPGWADTRCQYRKNITIDNTKVSSDLANFPVYIDLYDSDLQQKAQASGNDILFTNASGHLLDHEIEVYDRVSNSSHAHLVAWVKTNLSSTQDTIISMYYGNPTAINQENPEGVWDNNYEFVLHMNQDPASSDILDSTSNGFDFDVDVSAGMTSDDLVDGQTGMALALDGNNDFIYLPIAEGFTGPTDKFTFEFWILFPNGGPELRDTLARPATSNMEPHLAFYKEFDFEVETSSSAYISTSQDFQSLVGTWQHLVVEWDGTGGGLHRIYHNGSLDNDDLTPLTGTHISWNTLSIGTEDDPIDGPGGTFDNARCLDAHLSEFRLSSSIRSASWISTEFNNQKDPTTFYSVDSVENYVAVTEWYFPGLRYRKSITIDATKVSGSGSLSNFPVLIDLIDTDLHHPYKVQADGDDILFCDVNGNMLDHEIELFDQNYDSTRAHLIAWVKIPTISGTDDTTIYLYFGNKGLSSQSNAEGVWDSNYVGVWHLNQDPSGSAPQILDSTSPYTHGTANASMSSNDLVSGVIGDALNLDGTEDFIDFGNPSEMQITGALTVETWFWSDSDQNEYVIGKNGPGPDMRCWDLSFDPHNGTHGSLVFRYDTDGVLPHYGEVSNVYYEVGKWHHVVGVFYPSTYLRMYLNGQLVYDNSTAASSQYDPGNPLRFGARGDEISPDDTPFYDGKIDEARISNIARSSEWVITGYNNQFDPNGFYSVNPTEIRGNWTIPYLRYKKSITIDSSMVSGTDDLLNFPVLVELFDSDLRSTQKVQSDGDDIAFTDSSGAVLDHEIELFDQSFNSTHAHLIAWVEVPILKGTVDTEINMWYGNSAVTSLANPNGLWGNYACVYHLHDDFLDSTSNNNDGTNYQSDDVSAHIADGQDFDGIDDYINVGSGSSIDNVFNGGASISVWIYPEGWGGGEYGRILDKSTNTLGYDGWSMTVDGEASPAANHHLLFFRDFQTERGLWYTPEDSISLNQWHYVVINFDDGSTSNDPTIYINGVSQSLVEEDTPDGSAVTDSAQSMYIGNYLGGTRAFDGSIDEVRISSAIRSGDWVNTEYNNQLNPKNYMSVGNETQRSWADATFSYSKDIVINPTKVPEDSENFPVLLDITDSGLKNGIVQPNGADILFYDPSGTKLDHEIESFQQNSTYGHLITWVKVPHIFSADYTTISMYYGKTQLKAQQNPEGVWGSSYGGVWHLNEDPNGIAPQFPDSTYNNNDGTTGGSAGTLSQTTGQINNSLSFPVVHQDNLVDIGNDGTLQFSSNIWVSVWVKTSDTDPDVDVVLAKWGDTASKQNYFLGKLGASSTFEFIVDSSENVAISMSKINDGTWHYIVGVADSANNQLRLYVDGVLEGTNSYDGSSVMDSTSLYLGRNPGAMPDSDQAWGGEIDECRVSNNIHSGNWILTEYNNQNDTLGFYSLTSEYTLDVSPPIINSFGVEDLGTGMGNYWADITDSISDVSDAKITINGTEYDMSFNGSFWTYTASVIFGGYYEFQITNASDVRGNFLTSASIVKQVTFINDYVAPNIDQWNFDDAIGPYGTFKANVSDPWGDLDTVIVNVTELNSA